MFTQKITDTRLLLEFNTTKELEKQYLDMLIEACDFIVSEGKPYSENYDIKHNSFSLLHLIDDRKRFDIGKGAFNIIIEDNKIVAMSGIYMHDNEIAILNCRAWKHPESRVKINFMKPLLGRQLDVAKSLGAKKIWITANEYNKDFLLWSINYVNRLFHDRVDFSYIGLKTVKTIDQHVIESHLC